LNQARPTTTSQLRYDEQGRIDLKSLDLTRLQQWFRSEVNSTPERATATFKWLWQRGARRISDMVGISAEIRARLEERAFISGLEPELVQQSADGTTKYLWRLVDGHMIESVLIPDKSRLTLCMSSQVGCAMACTFCLTGDLGLKRNLTVAEIANQALQVQHDIGLERPITNLVFMGMGEPLHNLDHLIPALRICLDDNGLNFSHRRVTVSTVGLADKLSELAEAVPVNLAVSLNATTQEQRRQIMPITRRHTVADLIESCRNFPLRRGKRITFEYVMFKGFNDTLEDAERLMLLLQGIHAKINLIPYNENPDRDIERPSDAIVKSFQHYLVSRGVNCSVRATRGRDISAACGQLGKAGERETVGGFFG
jgi:23S rRNA (adenine2503-C2)-methyltransferase